jgi:sulfur-oxidizing protein SoxY
MERRKFLGLGLAAVAFAPATLSALDYRKEKPAAWEAKKVDEAIKALYGDIKAEESGIKLNVPKIASNGGAVPVKIKSDIAMKSLTVLQDANPEAAVATFTMDENTVIDLMLKIKMGQSGSITIIGEGQDGKFYSATQKLEVALGGCEG